MSALPISRKRPPRGSSVQRGVDEIPGEGVEDDVHPLAIGSGEKLLAETEVARGGDAVVCQTRLAQRIPLVRMGGCEDLGAEIAGEIDRATADAAGAGVDQHPLAGLQASEVGEAVEGRERDDRHGGALRLRPPGGQAPQHLPLGHRKRTEGVGDQAEDGVARRPGP